MGHALQPSDFLYFSTELFISLCALLWALYLRRHASSRRPGQRRFGDHWWHTRLREWRVLESQDQDGEALAEASRYDERIRASALMGLSLAIVVYVVISAALSLLTTGSLEGLWAWSGNVPWAALLLCFAIGYGLGYGAGVWRLRRTSTRAIAYADLQPRRLTDYRSTAFRWLSIALILGLTILTALPTFWLGSQIAFETEVGRHLQASTWVLGLLPAVMVFVLVIGELLVARIASLPRLSITADPQMAQRADNLLRALAIGTLQGMLFIALSALGLAQVHLLTSALEQQRLWLGDTQPYMALLDWVSRFAGAFSVIGFLLPYCYGRLGGKVSGWVRRPMRLAA